MGRLVADAHLGGKALVAGDFVAALQFAEEREAIKLRGLGNSLQSVARVSLSNSGQAQQPFPRMPPVMPRSV